jgi:hypothetical protein
MNKNLDLIKVENAPGLARCRKSGAIININNSEIEGARARKAQKKKESKRIENLEEELQGIKSLLIQLIEKIDG